MNIITSCYLPCVTEAKIITPKGKILGVFLNGSELNVSILHTKDADKVETQFHVIHEPTKMTSIDSLGEYYGSFVINGHYYHVFKQLY